MIKAFFLGILLVLNFAEASPAKLGSYHEMLDTEGCLRPHYQWLQEKYSAVFPRPRFEFQQTLARGPLLDCLQVFPVPLVLSSAESTFLQKAAQQRASALKALFVDLFLGPMKIVHERKLFSENFLRFLLMDQEINLEFVREIYQGRTAEDIRFRYGPDIVRNQHGQWLIMEDNVGNIGGLADVIPMRFLFEMERAFGSANEDSSDSSQQDRKHLMRILVEDAPEQVLTLVAQDPVNLALMAFFKDIDLPLESVSSQVAAFQFSRNPEETKLWPDRDRERERIVSRVETLTNIAMMSDPVEFLEQLAGGEVTAILNFDEITGSRAERFAYLNGAFVEQGIAFFESPFTEILAHKSLLPFMDEIVRFYMNQEPLIQTIPTHLMTGPEVIPQDIENWVFKRTNQRAGEGVYLGSMFHAPFRDAWLEKFRDIADGVKSSSFTAEPFPSYVYQEYVKPSVLPEGGPHSWAYRHVDLRPFVYVTGKGLPVTSPAMWGRAVPEFEGKSNLSIEGTASAALVVLVADDCEGLLGTDR